MLEIANASPVAIIRPDAAISSLRRSTLAPSRPMPSVIDAEPNSARVATMPTSNGPSPIAVR